MAASYTAERQFTGAIYSGGGPAHQGDQTAGKDFIINTTNIFNTLPPLARDVIQSCRSSSDVFMNLAVDVTAMNAVLGEIGESAQKQSLTPAQQQRLGSVSKGCYDGLKKLQDMQTKYDGVDLRTQMRWDRIDAVSYELEEIRSQLARHTGYLNAFLNSLINSSQARIEKLLLKFLREVRQGYHEGSVASRLTIDGSKKTVNEEDQREIGEELANIGISPDLFDKHRQFIITKIEEVAVEEASEQEGDQMDPQSISPPPGSPPLTPGAGIESPELRPEDSFSLASDGSDDAVSESSTLPEVLRIGAIPQSPNVTVTTDKQAEVQEQHGREHSEVPAAEPVKLSTNPSYDRPTSSSRSSSRSSARSNSVERVQSQETQKEWEELSSSVLKLGLPTSPNSSHSRPHSQSVEAIANTTSNITRDGHEKPAKRSSLQLRSYGGLPAPRSVPLSLNSTAQGRSEFAPKSPKRPLPFGSAELIPSFYPPFSQPLPLDGGKPRFSTQMRSEARNLNSYYAPPDPDDSSVAAWADREWFTSNGARDGQPTHDLRKTHTPSTSGVVSRFPQFSLSTPEGQSVNLFQPAEETPPGNETKNARDIQRVVPKGRIRLIGAMIMGNQHNMAFLDAAEAGDLHEMQKQIQKGANIEYTPNNEMQQTALMLAARAGDLVIAGSLLVNLANVHATDHRGATALHFAAEAGRADVIPFLRDRGAHIDARDALRLRTPLHYAVKAWGRATPSDALMAVVRCLLDNGANADIQDSQGLTVLHLAVQNSSRDIALVLLAHGVKTYVENFGGYTAAQYAASENNKSMLNLLQPGADLLDPNFWRLKSVGSSR